MSETTFAGETGAPKLFPVTQLDLGLIEAKPQIRRHFDEDSIRELGESIKEHGLVQPIVVKASKDGKHELIAGERRVRAARAAGLASLPTIVRDDLSETDAAVLQAIENLQREQLTPSEECAGVSTLVAAIGFDETCKKLGKSPGWVSKRDGLKDLPEEVRALVENGHIADLEIAHAVGELKKYSSNDFKNALVDYSNDSDWAKRPTREAIRARVRYAKQHWEEKEKEKAKKQKELERIKANPKLAEKAKKEKEAARQAKAEKDLRPFQVKQLRQEEDRVCNELTAALLALMPGNFSKARAQDLPARVRCMRHFSEWDREPLPPNLEGVDFSVDFDGSVSMIANAVNVLAPGATVSMQLTEITQDQARAIEQVLGRPAPVTLYVRKLTPKKIRTLLGTATRTPPKAESPEKQGDLTIGAFIAEQLVRDKAAKTKAAELYMAYEAWCKTGGFEPIAFNDNRWGEAIAAAKIKKHRLSTGWHYLGVKLKG